MIKFENVSFVYPTKDIYDDISFEIQRGDHAVLIGSNGVGKSTLVKLITNTDDMTYEGVIEKDFNMRIATVEQFVEHDSTDKTAFDYLAAPFLKLQSDIDDVCEIMGDEDAPPDIYEEYQELLDEMDSLDGYSYEHNIRKELALAGIAEIENTPVNMISGGEYKLLSIIRSMMQKPQLLIMDEPDVFLDFENLVGLIKLINNYEGTILSITHNRLLLNQCFDVVLHAEAEKLQQFPGSFAEYNLALLETKIDMHESRTRFDNYIDEMNEYIGELVKDASEFASPKKGKQIKARKSYLERIIKMRGEYPFLEDDKYDFTLPEVVNGEDETADHVLLSVRDYSLHFDRRILDDVNFDIKKGDKISIVGANGTGKSSLLKDLYKNLSDVYGDKVAMFSQIYNDDSVQLSGGERNIRQLEEICSSGASILLLDEPTSHLDIYAQSALETAIQNYNGTVIMVSHDFYMVTGCVERIFLLEDGTMRETSGRAYRKSVYRKYFDSEVFEREKLRKEVEMKVNGLIGAGKYDEARELLATVTE